jgi:agmatinase
MEYLSTKENFLGIENENFFSYENANCVIQQISYEHTSSYKLGSAKGPAAILANSHYVELYDIELNQNIFEKCGIASLPPINFNGKVNKDAMDIIKNETSVLINDKKFVVSLGAEHTVTAPLFRAHQEKYQDLAIIQIDAHSDLRLAYQGNRYSHASVMEQIHRMNQPRIFQVGIRAQCIEEAQLMKSSPNIHCWYAKDIHDNEIWMEEIVERLPKNVYITIDTDGFDPSICPSVGTAEPGGLLWYPTLKFFKKVFKKVNVVGFDIVELNPKADDDITAYNMAQLCYKLIGYKFAL